jgi:hypothetical protein
MTPTAGSGSAMGKAVAEGWCCARSASGFQGLMCFF